MISIELINGEFIVSPIGSIENALKKMQLIKNKKWNSAKKAWIVDKDSIKDVIALFGFHIKFITPLKDCVQTEEKQNEGYDSMDGFDGLKCTLYPFQVVGANFAADNKKVLIADLMGLGKTLQALGAFIKMRNRREVKNSLVVSPASVKYQWATEVESKTNLKAIVLQTPSKMKGKNKEEKEANALKQFENIYEYHVIIINYETLLNEFIFDQLMKLNIDVMIFDEIHMLKNKDAKRSKKAYEMSSSKKSVIGLSGTPLENRPPELYGVFKAIDSKLFPSWSSFASKHIKFVRYGIVAGYRQLPQLREKIQPYIIRRTLEDVAVQMPEKVFSTRTIEMTPEQRKLHDLLYNDIMEDMEKLKEAQSKYGHLMQPGKDGQYNPENDPEPIKKIKASILGRYSFLLEVCDSPELISLSQSGMAEKYKIKDNSSPKLDVLMETIEQIISQGSKLVVFTQYTRMLDIIQNKIYEEFKNIDTARIDGSVDAKQRLVEKDKFVNEDNCKVMLLTDAGNFGLNLQNANYLVMFEPPLKPSIYDQRVGRIVRIGSEHNHAFIINLVMEDGWDQKIFDILEKKREFTRVLVDKTDGESVAFNKAADNIQKDMERLIKKLSKSNKKKEK